VLSDDEAVSTQVGWNAGLGAVWSDRSAKVTVVSEDDAAVVSINALDIEDVSEVISTGDFQVVGGSSRSCVKNCIKSLSSGGGAQIEFTSGSGNGPDSPCDKAGLKKWITVALAEVPNSGELPSLRSGD